MTQHRPMLQKYLISDLPKAEDLLPQLRRLDENRWYSNFGPLATEFEHKMAKLFLAADAHTGLGAIHVTTMVTCYHALEAALRIMNVPKGGKVLIPAVTFPACPFAVQSAGGDALLADVDPASWTLTPDIARRVAGTTKLSAVMPVAIYGVPLPVPGWDAFTKDTGIPVIIDAAAAIESQAIPAHGFVAHSMHATKPFGIGEGGLLAARDPESVRKARTYSNFGMVDRITMQEGSNTKMSEYHAAVGLLQAERWGAVKTKRAELLKLYQKHLARLANHLSLQPDIEKAVVSCLMLRLNEPKAADVIVHSLKEKVMLHRMYLPPLYRHPHFANLAVASLEGKVLAAGGGEEAKVAHMPNSEMLLKHIIGVPFHPFLEEDDISYVAATLRQALAA